MAKKPEVKKPAAKPAPEKKQEQQGGAVALRGGSDLILDESKGLPDYVKTEAPRGSENVGTEDLLIPRLSIVQGLSPEIDPQNPLYIKGAKLGDLFNSATRQLYQSPVMVVPVHYQKMYLVWRDRKQGGGFFGAYPDQIAAQERADLEGGKNKGVEVMDTPTHLCLLIDRDRMTVDEIMVPMPRTKAKISRQWNSMVRMTTQDRFARVYALGVMKQTNPKGTFYNFTVAQSGIPAKSLYQAAEKLFNAINKGERVVNMDTRNMDAGGEPAGGGDDTDM